jgi:hypothetical protein
MRATTSTQRTTNTRSATTTTTTSKPTIAAVSLYTRRRVRSWRAWSWWPQPRVVVGLERGRSRGWRVGECGLVGRC